MEVRAITRNVRMSAQKMREMVRQSQGMNAAQAQAVLAVVPRKSARFVAKTLNSAIANAEDLKRNKSEYSGLVIEGLLVKEAVAQAAATLRRFTPKARGSAGPILKRNCHIRIVLSDDQNSQ
jgi:large subunit ribosomal protein L22